MGSGTADASGAFTYKVTTSVTTRHYTYVRPNGYFSALPQVQHQLYVPASGSFSGMKMSIDSFGKVKATGKLTRMYSIKASATKVNKGATVTFTGTLKEYVSGTWRPYKSKHVELFFQKKGSTKWTYTASGTTSSTGKATLKGKPTSDGKWLIQYFGDAKHYNSDGTAVYVDVR
jgi:hypothetical protein